ncbi:kinase suppressor of Ras 1-like isoform 2-T2 [Amazona ochrocephala]
MDRAAALRAAGMLERKERSGGEAAAGGGAGPRAGAAARGLPAVRSTLQQCGLLQDLIDISLSNLRGLRTKCAASNDLTQQEIRTLEVKLIDYIHRQRQCKLSVPLNDRTAELNSYPRFHDWLDIVNVRKEVVQRIPEELTLDALLEMNESKVKETMKRCGARDEECSRLNGALSCLRKVTESENLLDPFAFPAHSGRLTPRTPHSITITPPSTPQTKRRHKLKPPRTPPPPCRKVFQLLPNFPTLTRSKSHESQLGNRIDEVPPIK